MDKRLYSLYYPSLHLDSPQTKTSRTLRISAIERAEKSFASSATPSPQEPSPLPEILKKQRQVGEEVKKLPKKLTKKEALPVVSPAASHNNLWKEFCGKRSELFKTTQEKIGENESRRSARSLKTSIDESLCWRRISLNSQ
ncbi:hypothetical protein Q1695_003777 [Nippostrongylus brasiliensis]|nr:hypothetical protein Q1695_003777 [Nippostrongylus brasiliensis]